MTPSPADLSPAIRESLADHAATKLDLKRQLAARGFKLAKWCERENVAQAQVGIAALRALLEAEDPDALHAQRARYGMIDAVAR